MSYCLRKIRHSAGPDSTEHSLVSPVAQVGQCSRRWATWSWPGLRLLPRLRSGCSAHRRQPRPNLRTGAADCPAHGAGSQGPALTPSDRLTVRQARMRQGLSPRGMFSVAVEKCAGLCRNKKILVTKLRQKAGVMCSDLQCHCNPEKENT